VETGLVYNLARYFDRESSQFCSADPIGLSGGTNLYAYGLNYINWTDPLGLTGGRTTGENADILRRNMNREGRAVAPGQAAGHIVASTGSKGHWAAAADSRDILSAYDIEINDAANGVPVDHPRPHNKMHTRKFHMDVKARLTAVVDRMSAAGYGHRATRSALRRELRQIGREFTASCRG